MRNSLIIKPYYIPPSPSCILPHTWRRKQEAQRREDQEAAAASISSVSSLFIVNSEGVSSVQFSYQWEVSKVFRFFLAVEILIEKTNQQPPSPPCLSHSLGTVSLDKPQILPYPCIKREDAKSWKFFISGRFLKQDLRSRYKNNEHKINHRSDSWYKRKH